MAKTLNKQAIATTQDEAKKQRKKQAKREAKLMLRLEDAKKDVQRAQQKFAKAQSNLEACRGRLHELEEELGKIRERPAQQPESPVAEQPHEQSESSTPDKGDSYEDREVVEQLHQSSPLPVEGRTDISIENGSRASATPTPEEETGQPTTDAAAAENAPQ